MNNEGKIEIKKDSNVYLLKTFYLIKKNYPRSNVFYTIMYSFKYIGIIVSSRIIEMNENKGYISINKYLANMLIFGKNFSAIFNHYYLISLIGAITLLLFTIFTISCFIYMKIKYQKINSLKEEKMNKTNENIEEILCKIIAYFFIIIIFFHQYILEYYFFGFYSFLYYQSGLFSKNGQFSDIYIETLHTDLYDYFSNNNHLAIFDWHSYYVELNHSQKLTHFYSIGSTDKVYALVQKCIQTKAENGLASYQCLLGDLYRKGLAHMAKNEGKAKHWYNKVISENKNEECVEYAKKTLAKLQ